MKDLWKKYIVYLFRWQLSTPILALIITMSPVRNNLCNTIIANLVGGLLFFWIDRWIFNRKSDEREVENND